MKNFIKKEVLAHPIVLGAAALVVVIAVGSYVYYSNATNAPSTALPAEAGTSSVLATGVVEAAQSGELSFVSGGRVVRVPTVGARVGAGQTLAALDTSALAASRAQAQAGVAAAEAKLASLQAGARPEDIAVSQALVAQDQQSLSDTLSTAYTTADSAVHNTVDQFMNNPRTQPKLTFQTDSSVQNTVEFERLSAESALVAWQGAQGDTALAHAGIQAVAALLTDASNALNRAIIDTATTQTKITAYTAAVGTARSALNVAQTALNAAATKLATDQASLTLKQAPATASDIAAQQAVIQSAQASLSAATAALGNALIAAPFAGTVASVHVKSGDVVAPDTLAVSVTPNAALQVSAYFSETDVALLTVGGQADVTLDAYGDSRHFPARIVSVDKAPTMQNNVPAYKATLQFAAADPAITLGMTANITIQK